jgi:soluble lytic murein transglycosylase-like protein
MKVWSLARAMLALVGLLAVIATVAATMPASREWVVRQAVTLSQLALEPAGALSSAGEIQAEDHARIRDRQAIAEFIAKRYRVAEEAILPYVTTAYRAGALHQVDPLLILAVVAVESRYNPVAESVMGAKGLMQVIPKYHHEKLEEHGGADALLDPHVNIQVGARILREYMRRFGETQTALQMYAGSLDEPNAVYAGRVMAERSRLEQTLQRARRSAI